VDSPFLHVSRVPRISPIDQEIVEIKGIGVARFRRFYGKIRCPLFIRTSMMHSGIPHDDPLVFGDTTLVRLGTDYIQCILE